MKKCAVIDLGTNTFHLLAVESNGTSQEQLHKERIYVKLAEEGIETIGEAPFRRGIEALRSFQGTIEKLGVQKIKAFGTAALRTASNGPLFVEEVKNRIGINIELIPGKEEARLIHKGVMQAITLQDEKIVIMDIGGGSVEFIIADAHKVYWSESFPIGVAVLFKKFHHSNPITKEELGVLEKHLEKQLQPFIKELKKHDIDALVGASGTFDVLGTALPNFKKKKHSATVEVGEFDPLYKSLVHTTIEERLSMETIPNKRADMIVVAMELIRFVIRKTEIKNIIVSSFAMKEGILEELLKE